MAHAPEVRGPDRKLTLQELVEALLEDRLIEVGQARDLQVRLSGAHERPRHPLSLLARQEWTDPRRPGAHLGMDALLQWLAGRQKMEWARIDPLAIDVGEVTSVMPYAYASRVRVLPIRLTPAEIVVATAEPLEREWEAELARIESELALLRKGARSEEIEVARQRVATAKVAVDNATTQARRITQAYKGNSVTPQEYDRKADLAATNLMRFLEDKQVMPVKANMEPALREHLGRFVPEETRNFFWITAHYDPAPLYCHFYHWWDLARIRDTPHASPMRRGALLYNIFDSRNEGTATAVEEMFMHAGLYDDRPRSRELIWIMLAQRAARGLGSLYAHANEMTMQEAGNVSEMVFHSPFVPFSS